MRNERVNAALTLKQQIKATKRAANASLVEAGNLLVAMGQASIETGLFALGQPAIDKALELAAAAGSLRGLAGETHLLLASARTAAGLDAVAVGDDDDSPQPQRVRSLRAVA